MPVFSLICMQILGCMKQNYLIIFFFLFVTGLFGQALTVIDYPAVVEGTPDQNDIYLYVDIINSSNEEQVLLWERSIKSPPDGWLTWICDEINCYLPNIDRCSESKPNVIPAGDTLQMQIHVNPNNMEGSMDIDVAIFPLDDQENIMATISATFNVAQTTSVKELTREEIKIFPNPTTDQFQISHPAVARITLFNIVGNEMRTFNAVPGRTYDVSDLKSGLYLVRMTDEHNKVLKTVRLSKR